MSAMDEIYRGQGWLKYSVNAQLEYAVSSDADLASALEEVRKVGEQIFVLRRVEGREPETPEERVGLSSFWREVWEIPGTLSECSSGMQLCGVETEQTVFRTLAAFSHSEFTHTPPSSHAKSRSCSGSMFC